VTTTLAAVGMAVTKTRQEQQPPTTTWTTMSWTIFFEEEKKEEVKLGGGMLIASIVLMVYTAYQMSENPDGICASLCRLSITVIGCIVKIVLIPFKYVMGGGRQSGGHYMATPDYRDPYGSRHLELT